MPSLSEVRLWLLVACAAAGMLAACGASAARPTWWSEPFAYEQLLPQWHEQTAVATHADGATQVVASRGTVRVGGAEVVVERSGDVSVVSVRGQRGDGTCSVEFECAANACAPISRTWFDGGRVEGYDFLVASGEAWARFENRYDELGLYVGTDAIHPDGKRDVYATRTFDEATGRVLTLWPTTGCGHELQVDASLRPLTARGYCQQRLTEDEAFHYDAHGELASATVRYEPEAAPITYVFDWSPDRVTLRADAVGTTIEIRPDAATFDVPAEVLELAPEICDAGTPPHAWTEVP